MKKLKRKGANKSSSTSKKKKVGNNIEDSKLSIKILVDTKAKKVLFAEAGKDFVNLLFKVMSLPVSNLLSKNGMKDCVTSLTKSIDCSMRKQLFDKFYICSSCVNNGGCNTDCRGATCSKCGFRRKGSQSSANTGNKVTGGYVKGIVSYMVMDNLEVKPVQSTIAGLSIMNKLGVTDISALQERVVQIGFKEGFAMLRASLETETVLSTVFLNAKK